MSEKNPDIARFLGGVVKASDVERLRLPKKPRVVFSGRSNVGKSSLLNELTGLRVARVSAEPGKTREINFFEWKKMLLVDLPGYGYAKVSKELRSEWGTEITKWLTTDDGICLIVALVDGRHGYFESDLELIRFLRSENLPHIVAFTKMDKYKSNNQRRVAEKELAEASRKIGISDSVFISSTEKNGIFPLVKIIRTAVTTAL